MDNQKQRKTPELLLNGNSTRKEKFVYLSKNYKIIFKNFKIL